MISIRDDEGPGDGQVSLDQDDRRKRLPLTDPLQIFRNMALVDG
jgi:hypothetical protein